jgi:hypothetical protein
VNEFTFQIPLEVIGRRTAATHKAERDCEGEDEERDA